MTLAPHFRGRGWVGWLLGHGRVAVRISTGLRAFHVGFAVARDFSDLRIGIGLLCVLVEVLIDVRRRALSESEAKWREEVRRG